LPLRRDGQVMDFGNMSPYDIEPLLPKDHV
jgi:hypothetical protein